MAVAPLSAESLALQASLTDFLIYGVSKHQASYNTEFCDQRGFALGQPKPCVLQIAGWGGGADRASYDADVRALGGNSPAYSPSPSCAVRDQLHGSTPIPAQMQDR